ncbi:uncharacterized protein METZ01_LOCUS506162, partial [marine metagenome]
VADFKVSYKDNLSTEITHLDSGTKILTDAPIDNQSLGRTSSPTDLVASSLGSCMLTIIAIAQKTHNISIQKMSAKVSKIMSTELPRRISQIKVDLFITGDIDDKSRIIIERSAKHCPVHKSLNSEIILNFIYN